jgi:hypothetical protein
MSVLYTKCDSTVADIEIVSTYEITILVLAAVDAKHDLKAV